jgi:hypothetical protein
MDLDHILSSEESLVPASGFSRRVMEAISDLDAQPPPLTFPWLRFSVGFIASGIAAATGARFFEAAEVVAARPPIVAQDVGLAAVVVGACLGFVFRRRLARGK